MHSGTEKQHVADDYAKRLSIGQVECAALVADVAGAYMSEKSSSSPPSFQTCEYLNVSICPATVPGNVSTCTCTLYIVHLTACKTAILLLWWEIFVGQKMDYVLWVKITV